MRSMSADFSLLSGAENTMNRHGLSMDDVRNIYQNGQIINKYGKNFLIIGMGNITLGVNPLIHRINTIRVKHND